MPTARALLLCAALCLPLLAGAQVPAVSPAVTKEAVLDAPSALRAAEEPPATFALPAQPMAVPIAPAVSLTPAPQKKVINKKFLLLTGLAVAFTVADVELTQRCLRHHTCVELNPTLPTGHAAMYLANVPATGALFYWSYRRKANGQRLWWLPTLIDLLPHAAGAIDNTRFK